MKKRSSSVRVFQLLSFLLKLSGSAGNEDDGKRERRNKQRHDILTELIVKKCIVLYINVQMEGLD
jgi:hypothetical protein